MSPWTIVCLRCVLGAPLLLVVGLLRGEKLKASNAKEGWLQLVAGSLTVLHWVTLFMSIKASTTAAAMVIFYTYPLATAFLEAAVEHRRPRWQDVALCILALGGVAVLVDPSGIAAVGWEAIVSGIASACFWAGRNVLIRHTLQTARSGTIMMWSLVVGAIALSPSLFLEDNPEAWEVATWLKVIFLAFVVTALLHSMFLAGLKYVSATLASQIGTIQIVSAAIAGWLFIGEPITWRLVIGGLIVTAVGIGATAIKPKVAESRAEIESSDERL